VRALVPLGLLLCCGLQCNTQAPTTSESTPTLRAEAASGPGEKRLTPPSVDAPAPAPKEDLPLITLSIDELLLGSQHIADVRPGPLGFDGEIKRSHQRAALQLMPLDAALRPLAKPNETTIRVLADRGTSYRSALEVFYSASQAGFTSFSFLVSSQAGPRSVPVSTPSRAEWEAAHTAGALQPASFKVEARGISVTVGEIVVGGGCTLNAAGVTVPASGGKLDVAQVGACAASLKGMNPGWDRIGAANVTASGELTIETVLAIIVAIEATFPTVHLGMMTG